MSALDQLWVEKYRPQKLEDMILPDHMRKKFEEMRGGKFIPNLLLVSPPGRGKTTLAKIVAKELVPSEYLYINASEENGIDVVRNKIKHFAETASVFAVPKIIILDEADRLSAEAQDGLRNTMETFSDNVRFELTANDRSAIRDAIESRCQIFSDFSLPFDACYARSIHILEAEGVDYDPEVVKSILRKSLPDFRKAIISFQANFSDGKLHMDESGEESFQKVIDVLWSGIKSDKISVEKLREMIILNEHTFPSFEILAQTLHSHIYKIEDDKPLMRKSTGKIVEFLRYANNVMDVELSFYWLIIELRHLALRKI